MTAILVNSLAGGGAERIALNLFDEFKKKQGDTLFICIEKEQVYPPPENATVIYLTNFQKLYNPLFKMLWIFISAYRLNQYIKKHKIDSIQSHLFRANFINTTAKLFGSNHYAQIVSHLPVSFDESPYLTRKLKRFVYRWFYRRADEIVSISKMMKKGIEDTLHLEQYGIKHRVIYNPHDIEMISKTAREIPPSFFFSPEKEYIISASRLQKHKRIEVIIQALALLKAKKTNLELIILGEGDYKKELQQLVLSLKLEKRVHFLGHLPNPFSYLRNADIYVLASEKEGLPNIIIESLISGTPVVASDCVSGPREILSPNTDFRKQIQDEVEYAEYGVLFPVGNSQLLAAAIMELLDNDQLREKYIDSSRKYCSRFSKEAIASQYMEQEQAFVISQEQINTIDSNIS